MKITKKIGWQKYEESIKEQINSPFLKEIVENLILASQEEDEEDTDTSYQKEDDSKAIFSFPENIVKEATLASMFDCWIGHTNFNITEDIKNKVNRIDGVEILKIYTRYRFFIGIGKMFEFSKVREDIEKTIL